MVLKRTDLIKSSAVDVVSVVDDDDDDDAVAVEVMDLDLILGNLPRRLLLRRGRSLFSTLP